MIAPARAAAYEVLRRTFEHDAWTDRAFAAAINRHHLDNRDIPFARWLAYGAVRRRGTSDYLIGQLANRRIRKIDAPVLAAIRLGAYELLYGREPATHAIVSDCVELARGGLTGLHQGDKRRIRAGAGFVNALLRRIADHGRDILGNVDTRKPEGLAVLHSYPEWMVKMWVVEQGRDNAIALMEAMNEPAEVTFRDRRIEPAGNTSLLDGPDTVTADGDREENDALVDAGDPSRNRALSQAVVRVLAPQPGEHVADLCAGPGIKTAGIADRVGPEGQVTAVEPDRGRARQVVELVDDVTDLNVVEGDARTVDLPDAAYDRVLVDAPCSDLGTLASRPDARWRKTELTVTELAALQREILGRAATLVKPGGVIVYSTCTISRRENDLNVDGFLAENPDVTADNLGETSPGLACPYNPHFLQIRPDRDRTSGFFIARLRKRT